RPPPGSPRQTCTEIICPRAAANGEITMHGVRNPRRPSVLPEKTKRPQIQDSGNLKGLVWVAFRFSGWAALRPTKSAESVFSVLRLLTRLLRQGWHFHAGADNRFDLRRERAGVGDRRFADFRRGNRLVDQERDAAGPCRELPFRHDV